MNVKNYIYLTLCLFLFACVQDKRTGENAVADTIAVAGDSAAKTPVTVVQNPESVSEIKQAFAIINDKLQRALMDSISYKYDCSGERNGTITYYSDNGKLAVIRHSYNEYSHFSAIDHYFVNDGKLYFTFLNRSVWSFESGQAAEGATKEDNTEQRLYIHEKKPLLCLEKKYTTRPQSSNNPDPEIIQSKEVKCKSMEPVLKQYDRLLAFKDGSSHDCLMK